MTHAIARGPALCAAIREAGSAELAEPEAGFKSGDTVKVLDSESTRFSLYRVTLVERVGGGQARLSLAWLGSGAAAARKEHAAS